MEQQKYNILYIIEEFCLGGAERVVIDQALNLNRERFNVFVCCLWRKGEFGRILEKAGIPLIVLDKKPGLDLSIIPKVRRVLKDKQIDLVHTHLWVANFWGRMAALSAGVPVVITEHNIDVWKPWHYRFADWVLALFTKKICVVSAQVKKFYTRDVKLSAKKIEVVYNGIETRAQDTRHKTQVVPCALLRKELCLKKDIPVIAKIARLSDQKAHNVFVEALGILKKRKIKFYGLIVGDGPRRERIEQSVKRLGLEKCVFLTGLRKDIPDILGLTHICVLSSIREGLPIIILEAMAQGVPFVATDVGGNREVIEDGETGLIVPVNDPEALADAVEKLMKDSLLYKNMSQASIARVRENFSIEHMMESYQRIYLEELKVGSDKKAQDTGHKTQDTRHKTQDTRHRTQDTRGREAKSP